MKVNFVFMNKRETLNCEPNTKLSELYSKVAQMSFIPERSPIKNNDQFLLFHQGKVLDKDGTLESNQINENDEIIMSASFLD